MKSIPVEARSTVFMAEVLRSSFGVSSAFSRAKSAQPKPPFDDIEVACGVERWEPISASGLLAVLFVQDGRNVLQPNEKNANVVGLVFVSRRWGDGRIVA